MIYPINKNVAEVIFFLPTSNSNWLLLVQSGAFQKKKFNMTTTNNKTQRNDIDFIRLPNEILLINNPIINRTNIPPNTTKDIAYGYTTSTLFP